VVSILHGFEEFAQYIRKMGIETRTLTRLE
jgi:hypothetical protein